MRVEKIDRVVLAVKSIKQAAEFFHDILGIEFDECVEAKDLGIKVSYSSIGLQLNEATSPTSDVRKFIERKGEGFYCLVIKVTDIEAARNELKNKGLREVYHFKIGGLKEAIFHPKDAYGVMLVLTEYRDYHGATVAALGRRPSGLF